MLSDFDDTKVSLIINRCKGGKIGELCDKAIETMGKSDERYFYKVEIIIPVNLFQVKNNIIRRRY